MGASRETGARFVTGLQEDIGAVVTIDRGEVGQTLRKGKWPSPSPTWLEGSVTRRQLPTRRINRPLECSQPRRRKRKTSCYGTVAIAWMMGSLTCRRHITTVKVNKAVNTKIDRDHDRVSTSTQELPPHPQIGLHRVFSCTSCCLFLNFGRCLRQQQCPSN